ncbi:lipopolysaccharide biosynthesis protein [Pararcticibacter amylolyticus]|uniref:Uncharacterized protein n=1 Tax=Pararcticibacter amylolyticus TaxID=2173175 RepID=A0A2U2PI11_9SPHI|nr:oligosaccharide flippase family protein [Pararcticibacter amylolyticus]PWG81035.1 hypothetical protein DDR33_08895 [Pararcticibacter amylolyticus]
MSLLAKFTKFSLGTWISAGLSLISTPIISWFIIPEDFGKASMYLLAYNLLVNIFSLASEQSYYRFYKEKPSSEHSNLLVHCLVPPVAFTLLGILIMEFLKRPLSLFLFSNPGDVNSVRLLEFALFVGVIFKYPMAILRMSGQAIKYSIVQVTISVANVIAFFVVVKFFCQDYRSIIWGYVMSQTAGLFLSLILSQYGFSKIKNVRFDINEVKAILYYCIPFIPTFICDWFFHGIDRTFIRAYSSFSTLGLYAAGLKIAMSLNIIQTGFNVFWLPFSYDTYKEENSKEVLFPRIFNYLVLAFSVGILLVVMLNQVIIEVMAKEYSDVSAIFPLLMFGPMLYTLSEVTVVGINFSKKTIKHLYIIILSSLVNTTAAFLFIPRFGATGATVAMFIGYLCFFIARTLIGRKYYRIRIDFKKLTIAVLIVIIPVVSLMKLNSTLLAFPALLGIVILYRAESFILYDKLKSFL